MLLLLLLLRPQLPLTHLPLLFPSRHRHAQCRRRSLVPAAPCVNQLRPASPSSSHGRMDRALPWISLLLLLLVVLLLLVLLLLLRMILVRRLRRVLVRVLRREMIVRTGRDGARGRVDCRVGAQRMRRARALRVALLLLLLLLLSLLRVVLGAGRLRRGELEVVLLRRRGCVVGRLRLRLRVVRRVASHAQAAAAAAAAGGLVR